VLPACPLNQLCYPVCYEDAVICTSLFVVVVVVVELFFSA